MKAVLAVLLGLIGLLMSSCGLIFTTLGGSNSGVLVMALPSLAIGALFLWASHRLWKSRANEKSLPPTQ